MCNESHCTLHSPLHCTANVIAQPIPVPMVAIAFKVGLWLEELSVYRMGTLSELSWSHTAIRSVVSVSPLRHFASDTKWKKLVRHSSFLYQMSWRRREMSRANGKVWAVFRNRATARGQWALLSYILAMARSIMFKVGVWFETHKLQTFRLSGVGICTCRTPRFCTSRNQPSCFFLTLARSSPWRLSIISCP